MKFLHVVPNVKEEASGWAYSVPRLCEGLAARGHEVELSCLAVRNDIRGVRTSEYPALPVLRKFGISIGHTRALAARSREVDVVHNHSLWSMMNVVSGWVVPGSGAKLVVSPRGTLSRPALNRRRLVKRVLWVAQHRALAAADLVHATSADEYLDIRRRGFTKPVAIVPNGIDVPRAVPERRRRGVRTLLFLSRIHPKKGVERLLEAWKQLETTHSEWRLVVAGKGDERYERRVKAFAQRLKLRRVSFPGAVYGPEKDQLYSEADLFTLPTQSENFGNVVAEALSHGCPCVVSTGAPWSGMKTEGCGWWVDRDLSSFGGALDEAMSTPPDTLMNMGRKGRAWMQRDYDWDSIARKMDSAYRWILNGGERPSCVVTG